MENLPDTVVTAPSLLSFRHQLAKFNLSSFCVNVYFFYIYSFVLSLLCSLFCPCILSVLVAFGYFRYQ